MVNLFQLTSSTSFDIVGLVCGFNLVSIISCTLKSILPSLNYSSGFNIADHCYFMYPTIVTISIRRLKNPCRSSQRVIVLILNQISIYAKLFSLREEEGAPKFEKCREGETRNRICDGHVTALSNWTSP